MTTETVSFDADSLRLSALLDQPTAQSAYAVVVIVHGYGETRVVEQNWYYDLRTRLAERGIASFVWDKPGCGTSEGTFDPDQPVASSAQEVLAAAAYLRRRRVNGSGNIGLWGVSRAGWIAPLALSQDRDLTFWISVSGVDDKESFGYLLESNWRIEGYSEARINRLLSEWRNGNALALAGASYDDFLAQTRGYRTDPLVRYLNGSDNEVSQEAYSAVVEKWKAEPPVFDTETGLQVYVPAFSELLSSLDVPVLALFGEKDTSVNWRATKRLYENTIGTNPNASLTIQTFPDANHNLHQSRTGSFKEMIEILSAPTMAPGYYDTILGWLGETVTPNESTQTVIDN